MIPDLPDFLRRTDTEEARRRRRKLIVDYRERRIKNPPKRAKRCNKLLGRPFGATIRER